MAKLFIIIGIAFIIFGALSSIGFRGLPGDIVIQKKNATFIFPIVTSIALSVILSIILLLSRK